MRARRTNVIADEPSAATRAAAEGVELRRVSLPRVVGAELPVVLQPGPDRTIVSGRQLGLAGGSDDLAWFCICVPVKGT